MAGHWCRSVGPSVDLVSIDTGVGVSGGVGQCRGLVSKCRARAQAGRSGWAAIRWRQRLYEDMGIELARANYRMLMERTLPPRVGG